MKSLREYIAQAESNKSALGHFNISNIEALWGIFRAARAHDVPVIIGTSEGERSFVGARQVVALVRSIREEYGYPIFLNADHTYSFEKVKEAVDAGYDAVIFDGTKLPLEENVKITTQCVEYARSKDRDILVEGEIGYIGTSSKLLDTIPEGAEITEEHLTKPDELKEFVAQTGVDLVAPAVGNLHGMLKGGKNPNLHIGRIKELREAGGAPMVLHGGSGISEEDFRAGIKAGIAVVHVNTELRVAYRKALALSLQENPDEIAPYKLLKEPVMAIQKVVEEKLNLFSNP